MLLGGVVGTLDIAVAVTAAGGVGAAAAAGEAQLGVAFLDHGVARQIAGLLLLELHAGHVLQGVAVRTHHGVVVVDEHEVGIGELLSALARAASWRKPAHTMTFAPPSGGLLHGVVAVASVALSPLAGW